MVDITGTGNLQMRSNDNTPLLARLANWMKTNYIPFISGAVAMAVVAAAGALIVFGVKRHKLKQMTGKL